MIHKNNGKKNIKTAIILVMLSLLILTITSCQKNLEEKNIVKNDTIIEKPKNIKINKDDWNLILVDVNNKMDENFSVITGIIPPQYIVNSNANNVDERILEPLIQMVDDAELLGLKIRITSAYRDIEYQQNLFTSQVQKNLDAGLSQEESEKQAAEYVAIPGTSEHNTGLAVDLVSEDWFSENDNLYTTFETTDEAKWLFENAHKYGFMLSFPKDKVSITKISYEPWHYRYVGVENAKIIKENGYTLQEYLYYY